jgi:hypothetical protein
MQKMGAGKTPAPIFCFFPNFENAPIISRNVQQRGDLTGFKNLSGQNIEPFFNIFRFAERMPHDFNPGMGMDPGLGFVHPNA